MKISKLLQINKKAVIAVSFSFILFISFITLMTPKNNLDIDHKKNKTNIHIKTKDIISIGKIEINNSNISINSTNGFFKDLYRIEKTNKTTTLKFFSLKPKYTYGDIMLNNIEKINEIKIYDKNGEIIKSLVWTIY